MTGDEHDASEPAEPADSVLLARAAGGDGQACDLLVRRHLRSAVLLAAQLLGDRDDAEDVVQDAFMIVLDHATRFDAGRPFAPWLYGVVRNLATRARERRWRRRRLWMRWRGGDAEGAVQPEAESATEAGAALDRAATVVAALPPMQRVCFELVVMRGLGVADVAAMHDIAESTVRQHVFRARAALRKAVNV
jgi:RNA polymerase sigma-70 factor (ECF subfamily)